MRTFMEQLVSGEGVDVAVSNRGAEFQHGGAIVSVPAEVFWEVIRVFERIDDLMRPWEHEGIVGQLLAQFSQDPRIVGGFRIMAAERIEDTNAWLIRAKRLTDGRVFTLACRADVQDMLNAPDPSRSPESP